MDKSQFSARLNWLAHPLAYIGGLLVISGLARIVLTAVGMEEFQIGGVFGTHGLSGISAVGWGTVLFLVAVVLFAMAGIQEQLARIEARLSEGDRGRAP